MSRPARFTFLATILALALPLSGCKTIYSDTYSPRRSYFVRPQPKAETVPDLTVPATSPAVPAGGTTPSIPGLPDAGAPAPTIPGL